MDTPPAVALALLAAALPISLWVSLSDLREMRIPNPAVAALALAFAAIGLLCLPLEGWTLADWAWRWSHLLVVLVIGMALNAASMMGAGDAKFAAAAAPFVALADLGTVAALLAAATLAAWILHRIARHSFGPVLAPAWRSWGTGTKFPMGVAFGATLVGYLALAAFA